MSPLPPMRVEVAAAVQMIGDTLTDLKLRHFIERDEENPNLCSVGALDAGDHFRMGFVGWNDETDRLVFVAYNQSRANRDEAEGVDEEESKCYWQPKDAQMFLLHLDGTAAAVEAEMALEGPELGELDSP